MKIIIEEGEHYEQFGPGVYDLVEFDNGYQGIKNNAKPLDWAAVSDLILTLKKTCDECFGTGLKGGLQVPCSRGCST